MKDLYNMDLRGRLSLFIQNLLFERNFELEFGNEVHILMILLVIWVSQIPSYIIRMCTSFLKINHSLLNNIKNYFDVRVLYSKMLDQS